MVIGMKRMEVLKASLATTMMPWSLQAKSVKRRIAIIGHTGRGDYGHGLDTVWLNRPDCEIVGVADADPKGLQKTLQKLKLSNDLGFTHYATMLAEVRADVVSVCPRHVDQHYDMAKAAMENHAKGIYMEKPFVRTPHEADRLIAISRQTGTKLALAHRNRYHPVLPVVKKLLQDGLIGRVLEYRGRGKGDHRGGAQDLWVLGSHVLNLIHYFAGDPIHCSATLLQNGRLATLKDVREGDEGLGKIIGNECHARYLMTDGCMAYFDSLHQDGTQGQAFGFQIIGSEGVLHFHCDQNILVHLSKGHPFRVQNEVAKWIPITSGGVGQQELKLEEVTMCRNHVKGIQDLLDSLDEMREPLCNVLEGRVIVEMISSVFTSHTKQGQTITFPLAERENALDLWNI